tara:strand:- start:4154 stop:4588 length:435 start_codon:yes stop_codon:yes gene_type:complete
MGTSFYLYENEEELKKLYGVQLNEEMYCIKITDMFLKPNDVLWIIEEYNKIKEQPRIGRSIVHFRNTSFDEYKEGNEKLVLHDKLSFDVKRNKLQIFPKTLRKPEYEVKVDRYYGNPKKKKCKIDYDHRYYDLTSDRVNLVLKS